MDSQIQNEKNPFYNTPKHLQTEIHTMGERVNEVAYHLSDEVASRYGDLAEKLQLTADKSIQFVKKYPVYSVLGAATVGIVVGTLVRKKLI